jgi:predicted HicB family RNase H-like nuclease
MRPSKSYQFTVRVEGMDYDCITRAAEKLDIPKSQVVRFALRKHVAENRGKIPRAEVLGEAGGTLRDAAVVVRIDEELRDRVAKKAKESGVGLSDLRRYAIKKEIERLKEDNYL